MTRARESLIDLQSTSYYHLSNRCVRQAFLCGVDSATGKNYEHRRGLLLERVKFLSGAFTIGICAYAIMHNHYHLVVKVDKELALSLSDEDVINRYRAVYKGKHLIIDRYLEKESNDAEMLTAQAIIKTWRKRLYSISWFMAALNEYMAKVANSEDGCTGHFWQSRFSSQALLDDMAILACMAYVDLNPVRAGIAEDLIDSDFTSIQERIRVHAEAQNQECVDPSTTKSECFEQSKGLLPFVGSEAQPGICFTFTDYLALLENTGRCIHPTKRGRILPNRPRLLDLIELSTEDWVSLAQFFEKRFSGFAGKSEQLYSHAEKNGHCRYKGVG